MERKSEPIILGEEVLHESGAYQRVRRYYQGHHPELGVITNNGWQGQETIAEEDHIRPSVIVTVSDISDKN